MKRKSIFCIMANAIFALFSCTSIMDDMAYFLPDTINEDWSGCYVNGFIKAWNYQAMGYSQYFN